VAERFEDRHHVLREGRPNPGFAETEPMRTKRLEELRRFEARTGPLVDDLVVAVRKRQSCERCERWFRPPGADEDMAHKMSGCACDDGVDDRLVALDEAARA
jgi:hypothetical protein